MFFLFQAAKEVIAKARHSRVHMELGNLLA